MMVVIYDIDLKDYSDMGERLMELKYIDLYKCNSLINILNFG
jgi:hypothetical protein